MQTHLGPLADPTARAELYDTYRKSLAPVLVYLGGRADDFTETDHAFYSGEKISKSIIIINDHSFPVSLRLAWKCLNQQTRELVAGDSLTRKVAPGAIVKLPVEFTAPLIQNRGSLRLQLSAFDERGEVDINDQLDLQVFSKPRPLAAIPAVHGKILLFDPIGKTGKETPRWWMARRYYRVPESLIKFGQDNWIVVHVFDQKGGGGLTQGPFRLTIDAKTITADPTPYMPDLDMYDADAFHNW